MKRDKSHNSVKLWCSTDMVYPGILGYFLINNSSRLLRCGRHNYRLLSVLTLVLLPLTLYLALVTSLETPALPGGPVFGVVVLVIAGLAAGQVSYTVNFIGWEAGNYSNWTVYFVYILDCRNTCSPAIAANLGKLLGHCYFEGFYMF